LIISQWAYGILRKPFLFYKESVAKETQNYQRICKNIKY